MAQGLQLTQRLSQSLVLAPQLQQSLALLQAPMLELKALVETELQQNPVLEEVSPADSEASQKSEDDANRAADLAEPPSDVMFDPATEKPSAGPVDDFEAEFNRLAQIDQEWKEQYSQASMPMRASAEDEEKRQFMFDSLTAGTSLQEQLMDQVRMSEIEEDELPIAELLVGNIDDYGYLKATIDELSAANNLSGEDILEVLKIIQSFDPPGVGARNLRECLLLQLERAGQQKTTEYQIVSDHFEALGKRRIPEIARGLDLSNDEVQSAMERIARLEPRPGRQFLPDNDQYVVPEVFVVKSGDDFVVSTNNEQIPHLRISNTYKDLMSRSAVDLPALESAFVEADAALKGEVDAAVTAIKSNEDAAGLAALRSTAGRENLTRAQSDAIEHTIAQVMERQAFIEARNYIREKIRAGKFLIKSIDQRQQTILNIGKEIVKRQREFMEKGVAFLKPLTMVQVAEVVGVHETTVSRAVSGKYMQTPQGIFEMKYFFTTGIQTASGDGMSNTSVKDMIAEIFKNEDASKPLSDHQVVQMLKDKGVMIARRTVAKYRTELNILPSNLRKVY